TVSTLASAFPILALFVFPVTPSTDIYTLSLHDALPILYPGQKVMQTEVVLERAESLPGRKVSVISIADDMQIRLAEVCLQPPLGRGQEFYENTLTAGRKINGDFNKYNDLICVGEAGDILETLDIEIGRASCRER